MAEVAEVPTCSNPGCNQPGTKSCSACKITVYCCVICQTADWAHHKDECPGHLRKLGMAHLEKAEGFYQQQNWVQTLCYGELAATKLKQLKDRRLDTVQLISKVMSYKFDALQSMGRYGEAMECAEERYTLWAMNHLRNPGSMTAALRLIECCLHNQKFVDAERYARHAMFMIAEMTDNFIPAEERTKFLADASYYLAQAIFRLAIAGGIPPDEQQKAGKEAIMHARKALELRTQVYGTDSAFAASAMGGLADVLDYVDNDEVPRLLEQAIAIYRRLEGSSSLNLAVFKNNLGNSYYHGARRAAAANNMDRELTNLELAAPLFREAVRIFRTIDRIDQADAVQRNITTSEEQIRQIVIARAVASTAVAAVAARR